MDKETKKGIYLTLLGICGTFWMDPLLHYVTESGNYSYAIWNSFFPELVLLGLISIILAFPFTLMIIAPIEYLFRKSSVIQRIKKMRQAIFWTIASLITALLIMGNVLKGMPANLAEQNLSVYQSMHFLTCQVYYFMILDFCFFPWMFQRACAKIKDSDVEFL